MVYPHDIIGDVGLDRLVKVVFVRFLHCKGTISPFLYTVILIKTLGMSIPQNILTASHLTQCKCLNSYNDLQSFRITKLVPGSDSSPISDYPPPHSLHPSILCFAFLKPLTHAVT